MLEPWNEIIESQKIRSDLLKWKILTLAVLGATGLGLSGQSIPHADLVLCCVPFVCAYIDLLCRHLSLRIAVISEFWERGGFQADHESNASQHNKVKYLRRHQAYVQKALEKGIVTVQSMGFCAASKLKQH